MLRNEPLFIKIHVADQPLYTGKVCLLCILYISYMLRPSLGTFTTILLIYYKLSWHSVVFYRIFTMYFICYLIIVLYMIPYFTNVHLLVCYMNLSIPLIHGYARY